MSDNKADNQHKSKFIKLPGTKPSLQNAQLLVSTGVPSLDHLIGGGLPIGTIILIEEDKYGYYSKTMLKYFLVEGCVVGHELFVASQDTPPEKLVAELPAVIENGTGSLSAPANPIHDKMQIAWRYQNMKVTDSLLPNIKSNSFGHYYDITKNINKETVEKTHITYWNGDNCKWRACGFTNSVYIDLLKNIQRTLKERQFYVSSNSQNRTVQRIGIHSLGSRLWLNDNDGNSYSDLFKFLYYLRALLRNCFAVAMITVPIENFEQDEIVHRMEHISDTIIGLESFSDSSKEANTIYKDYHGLLHLKKLSAINTLEPHCPQSFDLGFKLRRKKFAIEVLHLPPELNSSEETDMTTSLLTACGTHQKLLDF